MKYIKLPTEWESQKRLFEDLDTYGYEEIPMGEFYAINNTTRCHKFELFPFTEKDLKKLYSLKTNLSKHLINKSCFYLVKTEINIDIMIYASNDEWYYIDKDRCYGENRHTYYKCDQFDGLLNCLKKEFDIE